MLRLKVRERTARCHMISGGIANDANDVSMETHSEFLWSRFDSIPQWLCEKRVSPKTSCFFRLCLSLFPLLMYENIYLFAHGGLTWYMVYLRYGLSYPK